MSKAKDIESLIGELTPEQIKALTEEIKKPRIRTIDTSFAERRMAITNLYFSAEPNHIWLIMTDGKNIQTIRKE